eukprot:TCONS_00059132-protein
MCGDNGAAPFVPVYKKLLKKWLPKNKRLFYQASGMITTGLFTCMFGMAFYWQIHQLSYFFLVQILTGITQSTGWPCVVEAVGSWFPEGRRGFVMGIWNTHVSVGNIIGSAIAASFVKSAWGLSFIIPGAMIAVMGVLNIVFLVPEPSFVDMEDENKKDDDLSQSGSANFKRKHERSNLVSPNPWSSIDEDDLTAHEPQPIGLWGALRIPGVIEYSLCLFFAKLVSYTFLFWLPLYITNITIGGVQYDDAKAADWAILFDVGGALGGITAGFLVDRTKAPGIINVSMLVLAAPCLFLFKFHGESKLSLFIFYMILSGFFVNGPYALITTAVSASLGTHECLRGNTKAMAVVTSIIDATGSLGAAVGPLMAGVISAHSWDDVFYMLIACDVIAAVLLMRQFITEVNQFRQKRQIANSVVDPDENKPLI